MIRQTGLALSLALVTSVSAAGAAEPIKLGIGAPLSGPDSVFGDQIRLGVDQAAADINAAGGVLGHKIKVVTGDDRSETKKGIEVAKGFVAAGIPFVVGHFSSAVTVPASAIYADAGALDLTPSAMAPLVTDRGLATVFRTCGREDQQAAVAARFLSARHFAKIAIVHDRSPTGKGFADAVRAALIANDNSIAFDGSVPPDAHDVSSLVNRLRAAGAQIVVWGGAPTGAAQLARQLRDADLALPLLGGLSLASDDYANLAGAAAEGTFIVFPQDPRKRPAAADLIRRLKSRGVDAFGYTFYAYAAVQVIKQAAEASQSLAPAAVAAKMHEGTPFQTVLGTLAFDAKGDPKTSDLTVYVWHKGVTGKMGFIDPPAS